MGGFFGVASKEACNLDLFYGTDYHSHLGTRRGGMATYGSDGWKRAIHNIENSPFRTKFEKDVDTMNGNIGIGCISDYDPQPILIQSHMGCFGITTVGKINNADQLIRNLYENGHTHFQSMTSGQINSTELVAALICKKDSFVEGIRYVQSVVEGSMTLLLLTENGIYAARDLLGRTPVVIGKKENAYCVSFESFAYINLGYTDYKELGPGEIVYVTPESVETVSPACEKMRICSFLWVYYGYPTSSYEGVGVEEMRYNCGKLLAQRDDHSIDVDIVAGVPDSGIAHAIGYANESGIPYARPFIKYTPTWPRSFMPTTQSQRNLIARMKLIRQLYEEKKELESSVQIEKQELSDYYSMWVHQIKTPIAALGVLIQSGEELEEVQESPKAQELTRSMKMEIFRIEQYVDMVLTYLRMGSATSDYAFRICSLEEIVRQAVRKYSQMFIMTRTRLHLEIQDQKILTDEKWLTFVIEQILSNAVKYARGGEISIYTEDKTLVIADDGIGIAEEDLPRIFEKGFTGYNGRANKKSTGIGLYLCKTIIDRLHHTIWIESKPEKGTKVYLNFDRESRRIE